MIVAACMKGTRSNDSIPGSTSPNGVEEAPGGKSKHSGKEIVLTTAAGAKIRVYWGVAVIGHWGNITTSSYLLSPLRVQVTGVDIHKREVKAFLLNKLKVQNLYTGVWQPEIGKEYQISLARAGDVYAGSLETDGIVVDGVTGSPGFQMNSSLRPILMEHGQQMHWESTGQEFQLLVDGEAQALSGQGHKTVAEFHLEDLDKKE